MRRALPLLLVLGLVLAATSGAADRTTRQRAVATAASSNDADYGTVRNDSLITAVDGDNVSARKAILSAADGEATARVFDVDVLNGLVTASGVRRSGEGHGKVYALRVAGAFIGDVSERRTIPITGGKVVLNSGTTGLRVKTADYDIRVAIAKVTTVKVEPTATPTPTASPSPAPEPTETATPKPTATATKTPAPKTTPTAKSRLTKGGYAFPVFGKARVADNFGAVRAAPIVTHEGDDIFAPFGSPVVAVRDGTIDHVGTLPISGNRLWLHTKNGDSFFYAHLSAFADATRDGEKVNAGTVLGFVGNTGDAEPTPPHLHFEVHPGGMNEAAVDPYPIVTAWQRRDDVPPGAWLQQLGADATERPGALVVVRDFIAE